MLDSHAYARNDKRSGNTHTRFDFATLDSHAYARNDERAGTPAPDLIFPLVIARCNECCDVAIKAKPHFRYAGFPRSLRSLGMTKGRFSFVFPLVIARNNECCDV